MKVSRAKALRGPNLWSQFTSIETLVTCTPEEQTLTNNSALVQGLRTHLPQLGQLPYHFAGQRKRTANSAVESSAPAALTLAHVFTAVALELQRAAGCPVEFQETRITDDGSAFFSVVQYSEEPVGRMAVEHAEALIAAVAAGKDYDYTTVIAQMREIDEDIRLGPSTGSIVYAGVRRNIPYRRLTEGSMVQFGYGSKQRRILAAESSDTSAIAESIAQDKELTKTLLHSAGVPVPNGRTVNDAEDAWAAAQEIGGPVAVKPRDGNQGKGISVNLKTREQVIAAFDLAYEISYNIIVERYLPGADFRLLVVGDNLVAVARRDPAHVVGDGEKNIAQLIDQVNLDPRRSDIAAAAVAAVKMVGLDIGGVDLVCEHIDQPLLEQGGGIVEVNAAPGLRMHLDPSYGPARDVGEAIINNMFKNGSDARIPLVAVTGTNGKTTTVRLIAHLMAQLGLRMGWTCSDGVYAKGERIDTGDCSGPKSARNLLAHPHVDGAVLETARGGMLREGLGFDLCDVGIVTNIGMGDHLGLNNINTVEGLAAVKRMIVENVKPDGAAILNAEDPMTVAMAPHASAEVTFFASHGSHPVIEQHKADGKPVAYRADNAIVIEHKSEQHVFLLKDIPLTRNGTITFQVENATCAIAAAWALGISTDLIKAGLASFVNDAQTAPGRFNVFDYKGATLIADYGHNPDAIIALVKAVEAMPANRRSTVISGAGDRRDQDLQMQTRILGDAFDEIILYEDACNRGRTEGEVVGLLRNGLQSAKRAKKISEIKGEFVAIDAALSRLESGDLCLILVDQVDEALEYIEKRCKEA
ncbi:MAG: cyanophycin synthetase [Burkholderiales bacterium]|nr:cyanophycin synthetase [Burkholderiales bacterium]